MHHKTNWWKFPFVAIALTLPALSQPSLTCASLETSGWVPSSGSLALVLNNQCNSRITAFSVYICKTAISGTSKECSTFTMDFWAGLQIESEIPAEQRRNIGGIQPGQIFRFNVGVPTPSGISKSLEIPGAILSGYVSENKEYGGDMLYVASIMKIRKIGINELKYWRSVLENASSQLRTGEKNAIELSDIRSNSHLFMYKGKERLQAQGVESEILNILNNESNNQSKTISINNIEKCLSFINLKIANGSKYIDEGILK